MRNPDDFTKQVLDLESRMEALQGDYSNIDKARETATWFQALVEQFQNIREDISLEIREIKGQYAPSRIGTSGLFGGMSSRVAERHAQVMRVERNRNLMPLVSLQSRINQRISQLDTAGVDLKSFIYRERERRLTERALANAYSDTENTSSAQEAHAFDPMWCMECGSGISKEDLFCRACGTPMVQVDA